MDRKKIPSVYTLADRCHEVGLTLPHGHEARDLLLLCRGRMLSDADYITKLERKLEAIRIALAPDIEEVGHP